MSGPRVTVQHRLGTVGLLVRSLVWTMLLPGVVVGYVPWRFLGLRHASFDGRLLQILGGVAIGAGILLLATCIVEFAKTGRGTLSPLDPPRELVVRGLYRYVRNPMYVSVGTILAGEALWAGSRPLAVYWLGFVCATNAFIRFVEEPALRRQFGESYERYTREVGRWLPRIPRAPRSGAEA